MDLFGGWVGGEKVNWGFGGVAILFGQPRVPQREFASFLAVDADGFKSDPQLLASEYAVIFTQAAEHAGEDGFDLVRLKGSLVITAAEELLLYVG